MISDEFAEKCGEIDLTILSNGKPKTNMKATIGEWHSYHLESNSKGEAILVTDGFSEGWFKENPTHKIMTREDGTWGHDLNTRMGRALAKFDEEQRAEEAGV